MKLYKHQLSELKQYIEPFNVVYKSDADLNYLFSLLPRKVQLCFYYDLQPFTLDDVNWNNVLSQYKPLSLGDRMKLYEKQLRHIMSPNNYIVVRLDGIKFSTYTKKFNKPFDDRLITTMNTTMLELCKFTNALVGYTQSDEITLWIHAPKENRQILRGGVVSKLNSELAAQATKIFNANLNILLESRNELNNFGLATFDCRCMEFPTEIEVLNAFIFRQQDWKRNNISMVAQNNFSYKSLHGKNRNDMNEMLLEIGIDFETDFPSHIQNGVICYKEITVLENEYGEFTRKKYKVTPAPIFIDEFNINNPISNLICE